ncbi:DgyrCDS3273 [Dimorphilus gyrociliatus]|uniref:sphinganine-1-phosphate aldolase n=1 Tax=Dimorphilus gyrociliatus TaxID=2664684 RepID=A0A7I8VFF9_9ANNE|nr:DgyrCDS3273 [Dimorphilus gyrociliatus]
MLILWLYWFEHLIFTLFLVIVLSIWGKEGFRGVAKIFVQAVRKIPAFNNLLSSILKKEVKNFVGTIKNTESDKSAAQPKVSLPKKGISHEELLKEMTKIKADDQDPSSGKLFAYVYTNENGHFDIQKEAYELFSEKTGYDGDHDKLVKEFYYAFMHENALNPMVFPSLRRFENEIVSMTASMLNGDDQVCGSLTSGGTESILMAMKAYRHRALKLFPHITNPEMVAPITIHPAHEKAASYFGFKIVHIPIDENCLPNMEKYEEAINANTIALLSSAPQYCHGVIDPIEDIAKLANKYDLPLHVDACFGGFMLPWVEKLGYNIPPFDFRVKGVTSMSADVHKYGFGAKGASVVLYNTAELRKYQMFAYAEWPGGLFGSPSMAGTRPGGNIAAAWAALKAMGQDGYLSMAKGLMETTSYLIEKINSIEGLTIMSKPHMTAFAFTSTDPSVCIYSLADALEEKGWKTERQQNPPSLHCTIMPNHAQVKEKLVEDIEYCIKTTKGKKDLAKKGTAGVYGMVGTIPDKSIVEDFLIEFFCQIYKS